MQDPDTFPPQVARRSFLQRCIIAPLAFILAACTGNSPTTPSAQKGTLSPTPTNSDGGQDEVTPSETEGPYFKPSSPERTSLREPGLGGTPLLVKGQVVDTKGQPIAHALLDFWHADAQGVYDNAGFKLRGHQYTDSQGQYSLETILPGFYYPRTRHIHVKVQAPNQAVLTTQLYFPGEARNATDSLFNPKLLLRVQDTSSEKVGTFQFVLSLV